MKLLSVIIPVHNEINTLLEILKRVEAVNIEKEIIIIDDFSTDGTREIIKSLNKNYIRTLFNEKNMGKGYSIRRGFGEAKGGIIIIQDADLEYYPDEYPIMIQKIIEGKADVVYGTRFLGSHRVFHFYHYLGNTLLNLIANFMYNTNLSDLMTCYKAFRRDVIENLALRANGFGIESEITAKIFKKRLKVYEVPISYDGRDFDEGKKISWKDFFYSVYWLIKCKFESYDAGKDTPYRMKVMKNNNKWIYSRIKPYIGRNVTEIGAGIGNMSKFLASANLKSVTITDKNPFRIDILKNKFIGNPKLKVFRHDIQKDDLAEIMNPAADTVISVNLLEQVEDDVKVLKNMNTLLQSNGKLILMVPAIKFLFGTLDKNMSHLRRYSKNELISLLETSGFKVKHIEYMNFISVFVWFINSRIFRKKHISNFQIIILDRFIPLIAFIERVFGVPFGLSIIAVAEKVS